MTYTEESIFIKQECSSLLLENTVANPRKSNAPLCTSKTMCNAQVNAFHLFLFSYIILYRFLHRKKQTFQYTNASIDTNKQI